MDQLKTFLNTLKPTYDDDTVDRFNNYYTSGLLAVFAITLIAKTYVGEPLQCWVPAQFTDFWEEYAESYCYVESTYYVPMAHNAVPTEQQKRDNREISYYQWVPWVLALQALLFYFPRIVWRLFNWQSGVNVQATVTAAADGKNFDVEERKKVVGTIAGHIMATTRMQQSLGRSDSVRSKVTSGGHFSGLYVTVVYFVTKVLYIVNVVGQFFILNSFLGKRHGEWWGASVLNDVVHGRDWEETGHFPRVTMCDFQIRSLGQIQNHTVQCVLMVNMFNEKVFLFLWWWFFVVAIITSISLLLWLYRTIASSHRRRFLFTYLKASDDKMKETINSPSVIEFAHDYILPDDMFLLRLIGDNAGDIFTAEIVTKLWQNFNETQNPHDTEERERLLEEKPKRLLLPA